ncbi:MAG: hypothetical protein J6X18_05680 [Bacteroidales bacterium]|nr:hypothetical protein [Bacteroidales bacterium]
MVNLNLTRFRRNVTTDGTFPKKIEEMCAYLSEQKLSLIELSPDGRINSALSESNVLDILKKGFPELTVPNGKSREWYDCAFRDDDGNFIPINIKISTMKSTPDNVSSKSGLFYTLTGVIPEKEYEWPEYFDKLNENIGKGWDSADYYFIVINKNDTSDVFCTSQKHLNVLVPNGNNLPFQCAWGANRIPIYRTNKESKEFLMGALTESIERSNEIYQNYHRVFG